MLGDALAAPELNPMQVGLRERHTIIIADSVRGVGDDLPHERRVPDRRHTIAAND
jgi:hypothetical protein